MQAFTGNRLLGSLATVIWLTGLVATNSFSQEVESAKQSPRIRLEQGDPSLPWNQAADGPKSPTPESTEKSKRFLLKVDESQLANLIDGTPFELQHETLVRVIDGLRRIDLNDLAKWENTSLSIADLAADPEPKKLEVMRISGTITSITKIRFSDKVVERFSVPGYYLVKMDLDNGDGKVVICARGLPEPWKKKVDTPFHAETLGLFLQTATAESLELPEETGDVPVFASSDFRWFPTEVNSELGVTKDLVQLAKSGVDIGKLLAVKQEADIESGPFYGIAGAIKAYGPAELDKIAQRYMNISALLQNPKAHTGEFVRVYGTARRAEKVLVPEDIAKELGIEYYYHLDVTVDLRDQKIVIGEDAGNRPEFNNEYPVTVCVLEIPEELQVDKMLNRQVEVPAVFFKNWAYSSDFMSQFGMDNQPSPVFIGYKPILLEKPKADTFWLSVISAVLFLTLLVTVWLSVWRFNRSDNQFQKRAMAGQFDFGGSDKVHGAPTDDDAKTDFSDPGVVISQDD
jgi:transcription antitermination factor NusG